MSDQLHVPRAVEDRLVDVLDPEPGSLWIEDATDAFPWIRDHRIWFGYNHAGEAAAIADRDGELLLLTGEDLGPISALLVRERRSIPGGLSASDLAHAFRRLTRPDPKGMIGGAGALDLPVMDPSGSELERATRQRDRETASQPPLLVPLGDTDYRLEFYFWTPSGAIERWDVEVLARCLRNARVSQLAEAGTYLYPFI